MRRMVSLLVFLSLAQWLTSQEMHVPEVRLPLMKTAPVIDGEIKDDEWSQASRMERLGRGKELTSGDVSFWVGSDGKRLYFGMVSETPPGGQILKRAVPLPGDTNVSEAFLDDSIELILDPLRNDPANRRFYHIIMNAAGAMYTMKHSPDQGAEAWRGTWKVASRIIDNRWHIEASVEVKDLGLKADELNDPMGIRICRNWRRTAQTVQTEWSPLGGPFLAPETMPVVTFDEGAPVVQVHQLMPPDSKVMGILVSVKNPGSSPLPVSVLTKSEPENSAHSEKKEDITLSPGELRRIELKGPASQQEDIYTIIKVTSPDGNKVYYLRDFVWKIERPEPFFLIDTDAEKQVSLDYAYYPYSNTIKARVNIAAVGNRDKVKEVVLAVRHKGGKSSIKEMAMPELKDYKTAAEMVIPPLKEGEYEIVVNLKGIKTAPAVFGFVRHTFDWEGNKMGRSNIVVKPFTPIKVSGRDISTVLRTHKMNELCLWDQVTSLDKPLLKSPMEVKALIDKKETTLRGSSFRIERSTDTLAVMSSRWSAGPLTGSAKAEWDYDGMMKWTLTIEPCKQEVERLYLKVPLYNPLMPLMHTCADGIRFNYAGSVPDGQGVVWDGTKAGKNSIIGTYVPYIWVGAEERGLSVFGENDRGWITDHKRPLQEMSREDDTLSLVLNLISVPATIDKSRTITVGFQATPVKPMPEDWRRWVYGAGCWLVPAKYNVKRISFMGSCYYWGSEDPASELYPRGHDLTLWEKFAETRRTGKIDSGYIEDWMKGYTKILDARAGKSEERRKGMLTNYRNHINHAFRQMAGAPEIVNVYTNARGIRLDTPEGQTFLDEWLRKQFSQRTFRYGSAVHYDIDPTESFRDYAIWYYNKMFDTFVDSIYWDNVFMTSVFNTVGTDAYQLPDGAIQPSSGLFNMRELIRRTAVLMAEKDISPITVAHMTNTAIAPVLSFAKVNYTWEDKVGALDFQERYSREYIRAESIGLQFGNVPFCLWLIRGPDKENNAWADRTGVGVALTHEIKPQGSPLFYNLYGKLLEFGYGTHEVKVSQYWKTEHPVRVKGSDAVTLVVYKPGDAIVVVSDWGDGGEMELLLDTKKMGLAGKTFTAKDIEDGTQLQAEPSAGSIKFSMKRHNFKAIRVTAE
jgi:hypothetical protein